ncbi:hypothetical protein V513_08890 [Mesotoga sp. H07.pep.5.3]|nr:hypothetical protein V513_08890 [Mesotoga sp. H07.pep.5.3]
MFQNLDDPKNRCTLMKTTLSVNGPPHPAEKIKTRSRNKFGMTLNRRPQTGALNKIISGQAHWGRLQGRLIGMTTNGYSEKARDSVIPTKLLVGISMLLLHGSPRRTDNRPTANQFLCSFQPLTTDLYPRSFEAPFDPQWLDKKSENHGFTI